MGGIIFNIIEILGIVAFAVSGAMIAINRRFDLFGVVFLGLVTALGGGAVRDIFLGSLPPRNFFNFSHLSIAIGTSLAVFLVAKIFRDFFFTENPKIDMAINILDAAGLAAFAITGVDLTVEKGYGDHEFFVVFMGIFTAVGGGLLRDSLSGYKPLIFCKNIYATAALIGTVIYYVTNYFFGVPHILCIILTFAVIISIRVLAAVFRWDLPKIEKPEE